jgi:ankyrin repeat protein
LEVVKALALLGADVNLPREDEVTPVLMAAQEGHLRVVQTLTELGADVNLADEEGVTPLFMAAAKGYEGIAVALVSLGADVNLRRTNRKGTQYFVDEFHNDPEEEGDCTPLMIAARNGHVRVVELLLRAGASAGVKLSDGRTALSLAMAAGHTDVASILAVV